ncbi:hypothetical protein [Flavobacterium chungangense]|uniref:Uncharacterized protein n=1 Tax=Flavobacterium chungangense TaxID=554283 RepID=A0A6V6YYV7_9FLAO|nr:hypothetical protein [Flavobacterium chungangense]CAD0004717.1 hypothetical protein FLACHUCJ7_01971 [Flavobacterium chungangense]
MIRGLWLDWVQLLFSGIQFRILVKPMLVHLKMLSERIYLKGNRYKPHKNM